MEKDRTTSKKEPERRSGLGIMRKEEVKEVLAVPDMIAPAAKEAGISVPADVEEYNPEEFRIGMSSARCS